MTINIKRERINSIFLVPDTTKDPFFFLMIRFGPGQIRPGSATLIYIFTLTKVISILNVILFTFTLIYARPARDYSTE